MAFIHWPANAFMLNLLGDVATCHVGLQLEGFDSVFVDAARASARITELQPMCMMRGSHLSRILWHASQPISPISASRADNADNVLGSCSLCLGPYKNGLYVCVYVCKYVTVCDYVCLSVCLFVCVCTHACKFACMHACMHACTNPCVALYVHMQSCKLACRCMC